MVGAIGVNVITFNVILRREKPLMGEKFAVPCNKKVDLKLITGAAIFGMGWGISGLCPGPGMVGFYVYGPCLYWLPAVAIGQIAQDYFNERVLVAEANE